MLRPWMLIVAVLAVTGCQSSGSTSTGADPFLGRTRVEPPRTGAIRGQLPSASNLSQAGQSGVAAPGAAIGQTGVLGGSVLPPSSTTTSNPSTTPRPSNGTPPGWAPAQPKATPVPAAIPSQSTGQYVPPDGSFSYPGPSNVSSLASSAGTGDRISIPAAARTIGAPGSDWSTRPVAESLSGMQSPPTGMGTSGTLSLPGSPPASSYGSPGGSAAADSYLGSTPTTSLAGRERIVRDLQPAASGVNSGPRFSSDAATTGGGIGSGSPPASASDKPVNIADLPEAR